MSYADRIRQASNPQEAMLIIAEGIDEVLAAGSSLDAGGWGSWGGGAGQQQQHVGSATAPQPEGNLYFDTIKPTPATPLELDLASRAVADAERDMQLANGTPQAREAMIRLDHARGVLKTLRDPGEILPVSGFVPGEELDINELPPPSATRMEARRKLAAALDLPSYFPPVMRGNETQRQEIIESFAKGGPLWLDLCTLPDQPHMKIIRQIPYEARVAMVHDVEIDSARAAWDLSRDILRDETGEVNTDVATSNINGVADAGGTPYQGKD